MTLVDLIAQFRSDSDDRVAPYLSSDDDVTLWLNEAEEEAALRANLIHDATTAAVCSIAVTAGVNVYPLHEAVFDITNAYFTPAGSTNVITLGLTDRIEQDRVRPGWRRLTEEPRQAIQNDTNIELACLPSTAGTLALECYRAPLDKMANDADSPEIGRAHHRHLVLWALHRHYSRPDADIFNPQGASKAETEFTRVFGLRPDADLRRSFQANRPMFNKSVW